MVRKRTRRHDSDDNDSDSDVEFNVSQLSKPTPKRYSLRQRHSAPLTVTNPYLAEEEDDPSQKDTSDEEFDVSEEADGQMIVNMPEMGILNNYPETCPENPEGLIDFEDIIRADIVVNRRKIDYDNLIQKTEIRLNVPKKRGRKPKSFYDEQNNENSENSSNIFEPQVQTFTPLLDTFADCIPDDRLAASFEDDPPPNDDPPQDEPQNGKEEVEKTTESPAPEEDKIEEKEEVVAAVAASTTEEASVKQEDKVDDDDDDDVIVLGELKQDVIVLDEDDD